MRTLCGHNGTQSTAGLCALFQARVATVEGLFTLLVLQKELIN